MTGIAPAEATGVILDGLRVLDLGRTSAVHMAGRIFADLGATTVRIDGASQDDVAGPDKPTESLRDKVWGLGTTRLSLPADSPDLALLLERADIILTTPYEPASLDPPRSLAPDAVWVAITPFGLAGPRKHWRASDLGLMASSGNLYLSGYDDRAPVRCSQPVSDAHLGPEIVTAALFARAAGGGRFVDLSGQEAIMMANMGLSDRARTTGQVLRRDGGRGGVGTSQVWGCRDGYVGLGLGGGVARQKTMDRLFEMMEQDGIYSADLAAEPWGSQRWSSMPPDQQDEVAGRIATFFKGRSANELQEIAYAESLMMAAVLRAREVISSEQLASRRFFVPFDGTGPPIPGPFVRVVSSVGSTLSSPEVGRAHTSVSVAEALDALADSAPTRSKRSGSSAWDGLTMVEFMSSAAGPFTGRFFAEHGADVIRVESRTRPDFLRTIALNPEYGLDAAPMFDSINAGKRSIAIDLTHVEGRAVARKLALRADVVTENFAPRTMPKLGLDYATIVADRRDLVMLSSCLSGQTGPHRDFPGFGGQGSALSGYTFLTGWPDRVPLGPAQAITDSVAPRFAALIIAAMLERRTRTGLGGYVDLSQVEVTTWTLSPWLLADGLLGTDDTRYGNRDATLRAVPHGVFPCQGHDRWVAIAVWDDEDWARLADLLPDVLHTWKTLEGRRDDIDAVESAVAAWTARRTPTQCAGILQAHGIEAVPVADGVDNIADPQLHARGHYQVASHSTLGERFYELAGFRISDTDGGYRRPSPLLGEHTHDILGDLLGLASRDIAALVDSGIVG